jgi:CDP-alcohol phosphatidyltransferase-like enzyme
MRGGARGDKVQSRASDRKSGALFVAEASGVRKPHSPTPPDRDHMTASPVPDLGTLRSICQGEKVRRDRRPWYVLSRQVSIRLTWVLLHTPVTANQVTLVSLLLTLAAAVLLAMPAPALALAGALALVIHYFLDKVDGEIARFRGVFSLTGVYMDELSHNFAYAGTFAGLGIHLAWRARDPAEAIQVLGAGMLGAVAMVVIRHNKSMGALLFAQYVLEQPRLLPAGEPAGASALLSREGVHRSRSGQGNGAERGAAARLLAMVRDLVLTVSEFTFVLLLALIGLVIEAATGSAVFLGGVVRAQALLQVAVLAALIGINARLNLATEVRRLNDLVRKRSEEP